MRDGEFATMMQHQEEDEAQKLMDKEQRAMSSIPTGKALVLVQIVLSLHHFLQSSIPQNLGVASKVTTLATESMLNFLDRLLHLQAVFRVCGKMPLCTQGSIPTLVITRDDLHQYIDEPHRKDHQHSNNKFFWPPSIPIISGLLGVFYTTVFFVPHFVILIANKLIA